MRNWKRNTSLVMSIAALALAVMLLGSCSLFGPGWAPRKIATLKFYDLITGAEITLPTTGVVATIMSGGEYSGNLTYDVNLAKSNKAVMGDINTAQNAVRLFDLDYTSGGLDEDTVFKISGVTGYKAFEAHPSLTGWTTDRYPVVEVILIPDTVTTNTAAYSISVRNKNTLAAVTAGNFVMTPTAYTISNTSDAAANRKWTQYKAPVGVAGPGVITGTISSTGTIDFAAGTLWVKATYSLATSGATGFLDEATATIKGDAFSSTTFVVASVQPTPYYIELTPVSSSVYDNETLQIVSQGHMTRTGTTWAPIIPTAGNALKYTFNYPVDLDYSGLTAVGINAQSLFGIITNDTNHNTTVINAPANLTAAYTTATTAVGLPGGITIALDAAKTTLTITAPYTTWITADDTGDTLYFPAQNALLTGIRVKRAGTGTAAASWSALNAVSVNADAAGGTLYNTVYVRLLN